MLPKEVITVAESLLSQHFGHTVEVTRTSGVGGGCINDAHRLETLAGSFFVKYNSASRYPGMFDAEAKGLVLLRNSNTLYVPEVIGNREAGPNSILVLEYIEPGVQQDDFWTNFGEGLAGLHQSLPDQGVKGFGLDHDNYIGSIPQQNKWHASWIDFFIIERLEAQLRIARDQGRAGSELSQLFQRLYKRLSDFFPEEPPALLHGDLWSGNFMTGCDGQAVIIDPAVYCGHRYMDLGMSLLFGGFSQAFYDSYDDAFPLEPSWRQSMDIANLYPLMVHVNLFGGGYLNSVKSVLRRF